MKSISVVIPNYNGKILFEKYLPYLFLALAKSKVAFEVIVSDDASTDDSISFLKEYYPQIILVENKSNLGFGGNANTGIHKAKMDLIFLLNNDVKLTENYFETLLPYFDDEKTFGVMGALTTEATGKIQDGAKYPKWKNGQMNFTLNYVFTGNHSKKAQSLFLSGANALVDRKKIQSIGGFDEIFNPFYFEDAELGVKSWRLGWKNYFEPKAICYHEISSTIKKHHQLKKIKITAKRNKFILHDLHLEGSKRFAWNLEKNLNLTFRWVIGDFDFYSAHSEYKKKKKEIEISRMNLQKLFEKENHKESLEEIAKKIILDIGKNKIKKF